MRTNKKLAIESLERREVFTGMPGVEGFDIYDAPLNVDDPVDTVQSMKHEIREHVQFCYQDGTDTICSVDSPRDASSGLPTGNRSTTDLEAQDKMCNFEVQGLMSRVQAQQLDVDGVDGVFTSLNWIDEYDFYAGFQS